MKISTEVVGTLSLGISLLKSNKLIIQHQQKLAIARWNMNKEALMYIVETPSDIFWSTRKMDAQYKHVNFLWRDKARYKEITQRQWAALKGSTKKKVWEISE